MKSHAVLLRRNDTPGPATAVKDSIMMNSFFGGMMSGIGGMFSFMAQMMQRMLQFMFGWL